MVTLEEEHRFEGELLQLTKGGRFEDALQNVERRLANCPSEDPDRLTLLGYKAFILREQGQFEEALKASRAAIECAHRHGNALAVAAEFDERAQIQCFADDYPAALRSLAFAEDYLREAPATDRYLSGRIAQTRGMAFRGCGWWEAAIESLEKAIDIFKYERKWRDWAMAIGDLASVALIKSRSDGPEESLLTKTLNLLRQARKEYEAAGYAATILQARVHELALRSELAAAQGATESLWSIYEEYRDGIRSLGGRTLDSHPDACLEPGVELLIGIARTVVALSEFAKGDSRLPQALGCQNIIWTIPRDASNLDDLLQEQSALHRARAALGFGPPRIAAERAADCLARALEIRSETSRLYGDPQLRALWQGSAGGLLQELAATAALSLSLDAPLAAVARRMISYIQTLRARHGSELVRSAQGYIMDTGVRSRIDEALARIRWLYRLQDRFEDAKAGVRRDLGSNLEGMPGYTSFERPPSPSAPLDHNPYPEYAFMVGRPLSIQRELDRLKADFMRQAAEGSLLHGQLRYIDSEAPLDVDELQARLNEGEVILDYYFGPSTLHVGVIAQRALHVLQLPLTRPKELYRLACDVIFPSTTASLARDLAPHGSETALMSGIRRCSEWLLPDSLVNLLDDLGARRVYVVASGPLWRVPFSWLKASGRLALERWELCLVPAACFAGAVPLIAQDLRGAVVGHPGKPYLASVEREVKAVAAELGCECHFGAAATPRRVLGELLPEANIIHFACHGNCDPASPLASSLLLQSDEEHEDGRLFLHEILTTVARTDVVSLAACHTARSDGPTSFPESLAHAFVGAGAQFVVASLWAADDAECTQFSTDFYHALAAYDPLQAFNKAQRAQVTRLRGTSQNPEFSEQEFLQMANFVAISARSHYRGQLIRG